MKPWHRLLILTAVGGAGLGGVWWARHPRPLPPGDVADRLARFSEPVERRLQPAFRHAGIPYPPSRLVLAGFKAERQLELYAAGPEGPLRLIKRYPIRAASGRSGPKLREGDRQVPEGIYGIKFLNPNSRFHLSMKVSYPNAFDREQAAREGRTGLGGDIMIHGKAASIGCLAMGDRAAEELFVLAALTGVESIRVLLAPVDFRKTDRLPEDGASLPSWVTETLYPSLKEALLQLPPPL